MEPGITHRIPEGMAYYCWPCYKAITGLDGRIMPERDTQLTLF